APQWPGPWQTPQFAILNHAAIDSGIPRESATQRLGIIHNSALFLDRDGVINVDRGYIHRSDQFEFVPRIFALARFWTNGGRSFLSPTSPASAAATSTKTLMRTRCDGCASALKRNAEYRRDHPWRKPKPGMLLQAASDLGLDPARCAILGDKMSDME